MSVHILSRRLLPLQKAARCNAHEGKIKGGTPCSFVRISVDSQGPFNVPICRICDALDDGELISAMTTEARRHHATGGQMTEFTRLMARKDKSHA